ncbi:MAG: cupredoxin domain-containing protein, partial [Chloroflexi bacterium]|nr:cupredoxin domain-containing protein [Chloroflexota bacterium]
MKPLRLLAATALAIVVVAWFSAAPSAQAQSTPVVEVTMLERGSQYVFEPKELTLPAGTIRFTFNNTG